MTKEQLSAIVKLDGNVAMPTARFCHLCMANAILIYDMDIFHIFAAENQKQ